MPLQQAVFETLGQAAGVNALVGARIYPDVAPQDAARPYIVWQEVSNVPANGLDGFLNLDNFRVQVTCWGVKATDVRDIDAAVRAAMDAATSFKSLQVDHRALPFEPDTKLFGSQSDFSVWLRT